MTKHVVSFSGGKDSTAMLLMMIERNMPIDRIVFIDTTKEFPQMYEHISKVQSYIRSPKIEIIKIDYDYWFGEHKKTRGKHKGKYGYGWADYKNRWCTALKRFYFKRTVYGDNNYDTRKRGTGKRDVVGIVEYHGIAYDERQRANKNNDGRDIRYPLISWEVTESQALAYCYNKGFDWGGLYEKLARVSCYCCPLSRIGELKIVYNEYPELWDNMREMDKKSFRQFRKEYTLDELEAKYKLENEIDKLQMRLYDREN